MMLMLRGHMTCTVDEYMTAVDYWQRFEPGAYEIFLSLPDPEKSLQRDNMKAMQEAERMGEPCVLLGENLPAFRRCVWEVIYT